MVHNIITVKLGHATITKYNLFKIFNITFYSVLYEKIGHGELRFSELLMHSRYFILYSARHFVK